jgi:uncharacterized small protein (DUF1192 family)
MTSISVSLGLWEVLRQRKKKQNTMDEFLRHLVADYYQIKEEFSFTEDAYNRASKKNEEFANREKLYLLKIKELEDKITILQSGNQVEPARGVAAEPYYPNKVPALQDIMTTNLPLKNLEEVTEKV